MVVFSWWCGGVFAVVFLWWCGDVFFVVVGWCFCVVVVLFLWWCFCGGFAVVFLWWWFCGGVVVFLWWCFWWWFCVFVVVFLFLWWCFCGGVERSLSNKDLLPRVVEANDLMLEVRMRLKNVDEKHLLCHDCSKAIGLFEVQLVQFVLGTKVPPQKHHHKNTTTKNITTRTPPQKHHHKNTTEEAPKMIVSREASSKFHRRSFQNEHFVRGFLQISQNKLPKRNRLKICMSPQFRTIDPPNPTRGFIQQNQNARLATAARRRAQKCMNPAHNVRGAATRGIQKSPFYYSFGRPTSTK